MSNEQLLALADEMAAENDELINYYSDQLRALATPSPQADKAREALAAPAEGAQGEAVARIRNLADELASKTDVFPAAANWAEEFRVQADILATRPAATAQAPIGFANLHEFNGKNDGFLIVRPQKAHSINNGGTFFTIPVYAAAPAAPKGGGVDEGCTPTDARALRAANHAFADECHRLKDALQFYADQDHFVLSDPDSWDTVSGEPSNLWCDEADTATVEDGSIARAAITPSTGQGEG